MALEPKLLSSVGAEIAVVVLNWNGIADTTACLTSLRESTVSVHSIVVDNGSGGDDVALLKESGLADAVLEAGDNLGYAAGNNLGLMYALNEGFAVVGVLNNDTIVDPDAIRSLTAHLPAAGGAHIAVSPDIRYFDDPSRSWFAGGVVDRGWPRHLQESEIAEPSFGPLRDSDILTGCCILARADTWRLVGLFDNGYFLIFEDSDWSARANQRGVRLVVATDATITHKVSQSFTAGPSSLLGHYYFARNGLRFDWIHARRHLPRFALQWVLRPTISAALRRRQQRGLAFSWLGALAFLVGQAGRAPRLVERLAYRRTR